MSNEKIPINRDEDGELLGFIVRDTAGWEAQTIFGASIARTESEMAARNIVCEKGLGHLMGLWNYFDEDDQAWYPCILKEANQSRVTVIRTNAMGYQDPDEYKLVIIDQPDETKLIKAG